MPALLLSLLKAAGGAFLGKLLGAAVTERLIAQAFFEIAEWLSKKTDNAIDDKLLAQLREAYNNEPNPGV